MPPTWDKWLKTPEKTDLSASSTRQSERLPLTSLLTGITAQEGWTQHTLLSAQRCSRQEMLTRDVAREVLPSR